MEINLKLSLEQVNGIIGVLGMLPFSQVADLLNNIRNQAIAQVQAATPPQQPETLTPEEV